MTPPLHTQQRCEVTPILDQPDEPRIRYAPGVDPREHDRSPFGIAIDEANRRHAAGVMWLEGELSRFIDRLAELQHRGYVIDHEAHEGPFVDPETGDWKVSVTAHWRRPEDDQ